MMHLTSQAVDNGERATVATEFYNGSAGVRSKDGKGEFAYRGTKPRQVVNARGTVGDRPVVILDVRKSDTASGMAVARFEYLEN